MSIQMEMKFRWGIVLNTTRFEWHELQHPISLIVKEIYSYEITQSFKKIKQFIFEKESISLYARFKEKNADVEFITIYTGTQELGVAGDAEAMVERFLGDDNG